MYRLTALEVHHCVHCGTESQPTWRFCRRCGTALENLEQEATAASCSSCSTPVAAGWRFCPNCGTGTETATEGAAGLSDDDVAELIASPGTTAAAPPTDSTPSGATAAEVETQDQQADAIEAIAADTAADQVAEAEFGRAIPGAADAAAPVADAEAATNGSAPLADTADPAVPSRADVTEAEGTIESVEPAEPSISPPKVSFEPGIDSGDAAGAGGAATPPPPAADMMTAPPPPPMDPALTDADDIVAAKASAEAPPEAAQRTDRAEPGLNRDVVDAEVIEARVVDKDIGAAETPVTDPFAPRDIADTDAPAPAADTAVGEPAVTIPGDAAEATPSIRSSIPKPLGTAASAAAPEIPRPIGDPEKADATAGEREPGSLAERVRSSTAPGGTVATPRTDDRDLAPGDADEDEDDLLPLDGRRFRNPGYMGQGLQVALIVTAALSVAMIVGLILLNNRLDGYATSGEGLARVTSAESLVNTWLRPLLIAAALGTYALLVMWARRVQDNLAVFNNAIDETPLWMWLMPVANMWVLFRHLDLSWKGSDHYARGARTWERGRPDVWTVAFVLLPVIGFLLIGYAWTLGAETFETALNANAFSMIGYALLALGLLAGVRSVANIIDRQRTRSESLSR